MRGGDHFIDDGTAKRDWMRAVAMVQDRDRCDFARACATARSENPDLFRAFYDIGGEQAKGRTV